MPTTAPADPHKTVLPALLERFRHVRALSLAWSALLSPEDQMVQSCPQASPVKWHLAHTTWFFETFLLREFLPAYVPFDADFLWLFNSYYKALGEHPEKSLRASFARPSLGQVLDYRAYVDHGVGQLLASLRTLPAATAREVADRMEIGFHHEQQHQELIATDIKHAFFTNPLRPAFRPLPQFELASAAPVEWLRFDAGLHTVGHEQDGFALDFAFDNESPAHPEFVPDFAIASQMVTVREYLQFMHDGGYKSAALWLSDGWDAVQVEGWQAPLYWRRSGEQAAGDWEIFTLHGFVAAAQLLDTPACHLSYYEAEAFAHWAGNRLPTEAEWETAAKASTGTAAAFLTAEALDRGLLHPTAQPGLLGAAWQWTQSAYLPYPGYKPLPGALGEYNGKFMSGQMVLRGGSCMTPAGHIRPTYRNFFKPETRWQFSGIRLAKDGQ